MLSLADLYRYFNAVQQHVGGTQQMRLLFLYAADLFLQYFVFGGIDVMLFHMVKRIVARETAGTARRSIIDSPSFGSRRLTIKRVTARGV